MHIPASDLHVYELGQDEIESAPCITYAQFRKKAKRYEWSPAFITERGDIPVETARLILNGRDAPGHHEDGKWVPGRHESLNEVVVSYWPLIQLYLSRR